MTAPAIRAQPQYSGCLRQRFQLPIALGELDDPGAVPLRSRPNATVRRCGGAAGRVQRPLIMSSPPASCTTVKILALDTSSEACSAALWVDGALSCEHAVAGQRHSQLLLPMVDSLLGSAGLDLHALDAVAFGEGPGSFTGLRIACAVAQGLAFGAGVPVVGIGTLLALAEASGGEEVACCLDARMNQVYFAAYRRSGPDWTCVHTPGLYAPDAVPPLPPGSWTGCGAGFAAYGEALHRALAVTWKALLPDALPQAREIAQLAAAALARGGGVHPRQGLPVYLRDKVALTVEEQR